MKRVLLCAALLAWSGLASAVVYKWVDAQGKVQYGDRPPDGVHAEVVELLGTHASSRSAAPAPAASDKATAPAANNTQVKKEVAADVAEAHEKQCAEAQDRYKKLIDGRHLYKTGENGERVYLSSDEIDTERLDAKKEIDDVCGQN
jgi:Domain of unknown function (DUF4124)